MDFFQVAPSAPLYLIRHVNKNPFTPNNMKHNVIKPSPQSTINKTMNFNNDTQREIEFTWIPQDMTITHLLNEVRDYCISEKTVNM